jgi:hypothetical protein
MLRRAALVENAFSSPTIAVSNFQIFCHIPDRNSLTVNFENTHENGTLIWKVVQYIWFQTGGAIYVHLWATRPNIPGDGTRHSNWRENLKSYKNRLSNNDRECDGYFRGDNFLYILKHNFMT